MSWQDRDNSQILQEEMVCEYPFIQYVNDGGSLEPRETTGGFAMSAEQAELLKATPNGGVEHTLIFSTGESERVFFTDWLRFVPLATRFAWVKDGNRLGGFVDGARGKLQALGYVETENGFAGPVMLTVKGMASKDLAQALREHRQAVRKATQGKAPSSFFAMLLHAGEPALRGTKQKSRATPIVRSNEFDPDVDYVGDELADLIEAEWELYKQWAAAWEHNPGPNGDGELADGDAPVEEEGAAPDVPTKTGKADAAPATESTKRLLTALMRGKGFTPDAIDSALDGITADAAQALLAELKRQG
ncbi:MAG TPA: hypothetical protein PKZ84_13420 [Anaerolineae bacterium]|nr:hypothetical protein [Anaerolineae bacterium]HQI86492.1 hypothetical protein [Anaerolineae bacterium]